MLTQEMTGRLQHGTVLTGEMQRSAKSLLPSTQETGRILPFESPPYMVNISTQALGLSQSNSGNQENGNAYAEVAGTAGKDAVGPKECTTCSNRKYVDKSDDSTVSFQSPTRVGPAAAETAVRAHEQEHVNKEQARAGEQGRKVVAQTVDIQYSTCPECGRSYVSGGMTTTATKAKEAAPPGPKTGGSVDLTA